MFPLPQLSFSHVTLCPSPQRRCSRACGATREEASVQDDLFIALVFGVIVSTDVLQPSYQFRQAFTCCTMCFKLNGSCFPGLNSYIAFSPSATSRTVSSWRHLLQMFAAFHASTVWWNLRCPPFAFASSRATLVWAICSAHPLAIAVVATQLVPKSSGTAFSLCM